MLGTTSISIVVAGWQFAVEGDESLVHPSLDALSEYTTIDGPAPIIPGNTRFEVKLVALHASDHAERLSKLRGAPHRRLRKYVDVEILETCQDGVRVHWSGSLDPVYYTSASSTTIALPASNVSSRELMRVCREVATRRHEDRGAIALHAVAVARRGSGVLIVGPSGSGKTTVLCHLLSEGEYSILGNDRIIFDPELDSLYATPLPVRVSAGTAHAFTEITALLGRGKLARPQPAPLEEFLRCTDESLLVTPNSEAKLELTPKEVAAAFDSSLAQVAKAAALIVPRFDRGTVGVELRTLATEQVMAVISAECRTPFDNLWPDLWLCDRGSRGDLWREAIARLASKPNFELAFGPSATSRGICEAVGAVLSATGMQS